MSVEQSHGWRGLPFIMDEYRQLLTANSKLMIYSFTEWAPPRRQVGEQAQTYLCIR